MQRRGKPTWVPPPHPRVVPWLELLNKIAQSYNLVPEFEIIATGTDHKPETNTLAMFVTIGSTEEYWMRLDAAKVIAQLVWEGLGLGGEPAVGSWSRAVAKKKVLLGIGDGHYATWHMYIVQ
ncbi:D-aminoacyl-tRNA deacylase-like [Syzygium oleosum]|uniref:D-aminoacyl-tRNA deacylase-like n=1 Tax=Syzygium oleosum TaxID=219896 RepID=UPI0024BB443D|nr:D-aminoacyl-tRNA deacylase-like [Syzygium oleosum]